MTVATRLDETLWVSAEGWERLNAELEELRGARRRDLAERLTHARADGSTDDNPLLHDLLEERMQLERRIALLEAQLAVAQIAKPARDGRAGIGTAVWVRNGRKRPVSYELVGPLEADASRGRVSLESPLGRALAGRRAGDRVVVDAPSGPVPLRILSVGRPS